MKMERFLILGCGRMGAALLRAWASGGLLSGVDVIAVDPNGANLTLESVGNLRFRLFSSLEEVPAEWQPDAVLLAVKPQSLAGLLPSLAARLGDAPLYLSIAAGKPLSFFEQALGAKARVIRAMPNTPALIGAGVTVLCQGHNTGKDEMDFAKSMFGAAGVVSVVDDEELMHAVTALSGSGPAYAFLFIEALAGAGESLGLDPQLARTLAEETLRGAAALSAFSRSETPAALRAQVTSPGGTTEAALAVLTGGNAFSALVKQAMDKAEKRSRELASMN